MAKIDFNFGTRDARSSVKVGAVILKVLKRILFFLLISVGMAVAGYCLFALVFSTDEERRLHRENRMYEKMYEEMLSREKLVGNVITSIQSRDSKVYKELFSAAPPPVDPIGSMVGNFYNDTVSTETLVPYVSARADSLHSVAKSVDADFLKIFLALARSGVATPPMSLPLDSISYAQIGASVGSRTNPFYKSEAQHNGIDLISSQGSPVYAAADGVVKLVKRSVKGLGNRIEIEHEGGYVTVYAHLSEMTVNQGAKVRRGQQIGTVGRTGNAYAPHLHYELHKDGEVLDPIYYFFASVSPQDYANMLYATITTKQSMD